MKGVKSVKGVEGVAFTRYSIINSGNFPVICWVSFVMSVIGMLLKINLNCLKLWHLNNLGENLIYKSINANPSANSYVLVNITPITF